MKRTLWSMGVVELQGMRDLRRSPSVLENCHPCTRTVVSPMYPDRTHLRPNYRQNPCVRRQVTRLSEAKHATETSTHFRSASEGHLPSWHDSTHQERPDGGRVLRL